MRTIYLFALLLLISGCSTLKTSQPKLTDSQKKTAWLTHKNTLNEIDEWQFSGRFSAQNETESWHGSISWTQKQNHFNILISGPLSSGSMSLSGDNKNSTLKLSNDHLFESSDPEALLEEHTGLQLPVKSLRYWLIGIPSNHNYSSTLNPHGQLDQLTQKGWDIAFKRYKQINNLALPNKIFLNNSEYTVRLVIKHWQILPS